MITELIDRLASANTGYRTIDYTPDLDPQDQLRTTMPLALFLKGPTKTEPSDTLPLRQRQTKSVMVMTICRQQELDTLIDELQSALLGYQHTVNYTPLIHTEGEIIRIDGEIVRWVDMFTTDHWIQEPTP